MKNLVLLLFILFTLPAVSQLCGSSVVPPALVNGVSVTATQSGSVSPYPTAYTSCGNTTPANSIHMGATGIFSYTFNFSVAVNNVVIIITATGSGVNEIFNLMTSSGAPAITINSSCFTTVTGAQISSGMGSGPTGGGGIFTVTALTPFTSLTISGPGGQAGSLFALCNNSVLPFNSANTVKMCDGDSILLQNAYQKTGGVYRDTLISSIGVDSIITTTLEIEERPVFGVAISNGYCVNTPVLFTNSTTSKDSISDYIWNFGDGAIITQSGSSISHPYATSGPKTVVLTANSLLGCNYDTTFVINVDDPPTADFSADSVCFSEATTIIDLSGVPVNITSWNYSLDGVTYSTQNVNHTFSTFGLKNIKLVVTNTSNCIDSVEKQTVVAPKPIVDFTYSPTELNFINPVACFNNNTQNATSYFWDFGFNTSTLENPCQDYSTQIGSNTAKLIARNDFGCIDSMEVEIVFGNLASVYMPNAFTPNDDDVNDVFTPQLLDIVSYEFLIFNRWGQLVFSSQEIGEGWDGKFNGEPAKSEVYVYTLVALTKRGQVKEYKGHVTLIR